MIYFGRYITHPLGGFTMFFESVKKKIRNSIIRWVLICPIVTVITSLLAFSNGFSSDADFSLKIFSVNTGIPLPNWLISGMFLLIAVGALIVFFTSLIDILKNETYNNFIASAQALGDLNAIDQYLTAMPANTLNKGGELKYNETIFFYINGTDAFIFLTRDIASINPIKKANTKEFIVEIMTKDNKKIEIKTTEGDLLTLANDINGCYLRAIAPVQQYSQQTYTPQQH